MVSIRGVAWILAAALTLAAYRPALADPITLTGNVASDFTIANGSYGIAVRKWKFLLFDWVDRRLRPNCPPAFLSKIFG